MCLCFVNSFSCLSFNPHGLSNLPSYLHMFHLCKGFLCVESYLLIFSTIRLVLTNIHVNATHRIFARILKTPVQNSNSNISARPVSATQLLKIIYSSSLLCRSRQLTLQPLPKRQIVRKKLADYPKKVKIENSLCKFLPVEK